MENQTKTEEQKNSIVDFYEKMENLIKNAPEGAEFFAMIKAPKGAKTEKIGESQITACQTTGGTLINLFANTFTQAPEVKRSVKLALTAAEMHDNPISTLMEFLQGGKPDISDFFKTCSRKGS